MKIDSLKIVQYLISDSENSQVEFKETTGQLERAMETVCAFLNGFGGTVLFGITDSGKIIGQMVADKTKREIAEAINRIEPMPLIQVSYIPLEDTEKQVIAIHMEDARMERPFMYKNRAYHRVESVTTAMPQNVYNQLLLFRDGSKYPWAELESPYLSLDDIDENEVLKTLRLGIQCGRLPENTGTDIPTILQKFGLYTNGKLNNAAAVLFSKGEIYGYPQCMVRLARFKGTDKQMFIDNLQVSGNIFTLLDASMAFIFKHLSLSGVIEGLEREEHLSVPYKAIRECVINALCHRDYRDKGASVGIAIYDDRVEIENKGTFPHDLDISDLLIRNISDPFNPPIAKVLYRRNLLENWGRGINLMISECRKAELPTPTFRLAHGFIVVTFKYNTYRSEVNEPQSYYGPKRTPKKYPTRTRRASYSTLQHPTVLDEAPTVLDMAPTVLNKPLTAPHSTPQHPTVPHSTPQLENLLQEIGYQTIPTPKIMELIGLKDKTNFLKNHLYPAISLGYIEPIYPNQPKHPKQKYRLTNKGKELLK